MIFEQARIIDQYGDVVKIKYPDWEGRGQTIELDRFEHKVIGEQGEKGRLREREGKWTFVAYRELTQPGTKIEIVAIVLPDFFDRLRAFIRRRPRPTPRAAIRVHVREERADAFSWKTIAPPPLAPGSTLAVFDKRPGTEHDGDFYPPQP